MPRYVLARGAGTLSMGTRRAPGAGGGVCGSGVLGRAREWWCSKICIRRHCCFCNVRGGRRGGAWCAVQLRRPVPVNRRASVLRARPRVAAGWHGHTEARTFALNASKGPRAKHR